MPSEGGRCDCADDGVENMPEAVEPNPAAAVLLLGLFIRPLEHKENAVGKLKIAVSNFFRIRLADPPALFSFCLRDDKAA